MFPFLNQQKPLVGVDITSTAVKLIELSATARKSGMHYRVEAYAVDPLPQEAMAEKKIQDVAAVGESIRKVLKRSGTKAKLAAVAVPSSAAITKVISMPDSLREQEMEAQIQLEADQYIPYPLEEVNLTFEILGPSERNPGHLDVLLAASRSENVDDRVAAMDMAGLSTKIVDIEAYAMANAVEYLIDQLPEGDGKPVIAVADVGATTTTINIVQHGRSIYTREQSFGGKQLTEEIQKRYGLSPEEAGMAKRQGGLPDNYGPEVLEPFKEAMSQQISRALQFFYSASSHSRVDGVVLAGGTASIADVEELVESRLGVPVLIANPFANMSISPKVKPQSLSNDAPAMMIAVGLALRGFDL